MKQNALAAAIGTEVRRNIYLVECFDKHGNLKWSDTIDNLVVDAGLNDSLEQYFNGSAYTAAFYIGLTDGTPTVAAGDVMSSHAGWAEVTAYSESTRPLYQTAAAASKQVTNGANKASFSITSDGTTIGGAFVTTNNTKGGTTGTLYGAGAFTGGDKVADNGDTLNVTVVASAAAA